MSHVVVADLEDIGTWRLRVQQGQMPGTWFSGDLSLSGTREHAFKGNASGEIRFAFDPQSTGPFYLHFERAKMSLLGGKLQCIEFDADGRGYPVSFSFQLVDAAKQRFRSEPVDLKGEGWQHYRVELNLQTVKRFNAIQFPVRLPQVSLHAGQPCAGTVYLDELTLCGEFAEKELQSISPVYEGIHYAPDRPVSLDYRIRNSRAFPAVADTRIEVSDFRGKPVYSAEHAIDLPEYGEAVLTCSVGELPIGAYSAKLTATVDGTTIRYDDCFCVMKPNNGRVNARPMWFGVNDSPIWQGPDENRLHLEWMQALGIDINRIMITPGRFEPWRDIFVSKPLERFFQEHAAHGVDVLALYVETPRWCRNAGGGRLQPPDDYGEFAKLCADFGRFLGRFPNVTYLEFWNEPDIGFFKGGIADYLKMLQVAYGAVKAENPSILITTGGVTMKHPREKKDFSRKMFVEGQAYYDVAAFHAHGPLGNYTERQDMLEQWLQDAGLEKPIANSESGERGGYTVAGRVNQAIALVKKMVYSKSRPSSAFHIWFTLQDYWDMDEGADDSFGLVTSDNRAKPSFGAYNEVIHQLANTTPEGKADFGAGICAYVFRRDDGSPVYVVWPEASFTGSVLWLSSERCIQKTDMFGRIEPLSTVAGVVPVALTKEPFYLSLVGEGEAPGIQLASPDKAFLLVSPELQDGMLNVVITNPLPEVFYGRVQMVEASGKRIADTPIELEVGEVKRLKHAVGELRTDLSLELLHGETPLLEVPLQPVPVYVVKQTNDVTDAGVAEVTLDQIQDVHELTFDPSIPAWQGKDDLSARFRMVHDGEALHLRCVVRDDQDVTGDLPDQMWRMDSVQLALGLPGELLYTVLAVGRVEGKAVVWCHRHADAAKLGRWMVEAKVERVGAETVYDIELPFDLCSIPYDDATRTPLRMALLINENDGQGRVRWLQWYDGIGEGYDPDLLGRVVLP